jgi:hypothetical protein
LLLVFAYSVLRLLLRLGTRGAELGVLRLSVLISWVELGKLLVDVAFVFLELLLAFLHQVLVVLLLDYLFLLLFEVQQEVLELLALW